MSIRVAIIGPTGYSGMHLIELLLRHPQAQITYLASRRSDPPHIDREFPRLLGRLPKQVAQCRPIDTRAIAGEADVVFCCLPQKVAMELVPALLEADLRVIDLSADYRLKDPSLYERTYGTVHRDRQRLGQAVYGLSEFYRDALGAARLVANPGCYPTAAALAIVPLVADRLVRPDRIIINAASGVTGAGRTPAPNLHYGEHNESFYAYGTIGKHRHQPEIEQVLADLSSVSVRVLFVPHLLPVDRGILETIYLDPAGADVTEEALFEAWHRRYDGEPFVRIRPDLPNIKDVRDSNFCDLSLRRTGSHIVAISAIDNMIKGASGQAVQNMNLMFGLPQTAGLI